MKLNKAGFREIVFAFILAWATLSMGGTPTRLQVVATEDGAKADLIVQQVNSLGVGPAIIDKTGSYFKVRTKEFSSYDEAVLAKPKLKEAGFGDAFPVSEFAVNFDMMDRRIEQDESEDLLDTRVEFTDKLRRLNNKTASESGLFQKVNSKRDSSDAAEAIAVCDVFLRRFPKSKHVPRVKLVRTYWLVNQERQDEARESFRKIASAHSKTTEGGEAALRLAYIMLRDGDPDEKVLNQFLDIASGKIRSSPEVRKAAILRTDSLYHRAIRDGVQIERQTSDTIARLIQQEIPLKETAPAADSEDNKPQE